MHETFQRENDDDDDDVHGRVRRTGTGNSRYREFLIFLVVSEKIGTGKKSRNRYWKNLVPEKVSEPVSEKFGTGKKYRY